MMTANVVKNLFLTGPVGCGKSTSIASALGPDLEKAGGFLTVRQRDETGKIVAFWLKKPDGRDGQIIIDGSEKTDTMHPGVFGCFGLRLLEEARKYDYVILDEIGGFEILSDAFLKALMELLQSDIPCIGVMKGEGPAGKMIRMLGLGDVYLERAASLRQWMRQDGNTLLYECGRFDPEGRRLAEEWTKRYVNK